MQLIPYVELNGSWTVTDDVIKTVYLKMKAQNLDRIVFSDSSVKDELNFLSRMKNRENLPIIIIDENNIIGFAWLNGLVKRRAFGHYFFFKEVWGKKTFEGAKLVIDYWLSLKTKNDYLFDFLIGNTPQENKLAIRFAQKLGFKIVGYVPTFGIISYLSR